MKPLTIVCSALLGVMLLGSAALAAQHQPGGQMPMPGQPGQPPGHAPMMGPGMMGMMCPMMAASMMGMMPMMQQMMGGQMDPSGMGMMGMMGGDKMDPKAMGRMLQMRGEMLKAMGDILLKHGKMMEEGK